MASPDGQSEKENVQPPVSESSCRAIRSSFLSQNGENGLEIGDIWPSDGHHHDDDEFEKSNGKTQEAMVRESKHLGDENIAAEGEKQSSSSTCKWFDLVDQYMHVQGVPGNEHNADNVDDGNINNGEAHIVGDIDNNVLHHEEEVMNSNPVGIHSGGLGHVDEVVNPNPVPLARVNDGPITMLSHVEEVNDANVVVNVNSNANVSDTLMLDHASCPESVVGIIPNNRIHESENTAKRARREQQIKESLSKMVKTWRDSLEVLKDLETTRVDTLQRLSSTMTGLLDVLKK